MAPTTSAIANRNRADGGDVGHEDRHLVDIVQRCDEVGLPAADPGVVLRVVVEAQAKAVRGDDLAVLAQQREGLVAELGVDQPVDAIGGDVA
ncbi:hypothetical protein ACGK9R_10560 [Halomonas sp. HNIBRBA4712]|uniref:hypothetical protein n=1 Tax=Halomonas sp. HNIBRBA4712 TaxID=3373087 RepID=UPI003745F367